MMKTESMQVLPRRRVLRYRGTWLAVFMMICAGAYPSAAQSPALTASSTNVSPGQEIFLTGRNYTPGAYPGQILFNGVPVDDYYIPAGGYFSTRFVIPPSAPSGENLIEVCAGNPCFTFEFEQRAGVTVSVSGSAGTSALDYQAQAFEVTQGVRGDVISRDAPAGDLVLPSETAVHISGRRTIVRVFPWVGGSGTVRRITARLYGSRDGNPLPGSPIAPVSGRLRHLSPSSTLEELRADPTLTWNFVLPESWTTVGGEPGDFTINLAVEVNPDGVDRWPECDGCFDNNTMYLGGVEFVSMTREEPRRIVGVTGASTAPLLIRPFLIDFDDPIELVNHPPPTRSDLSAVLGAIHRMFPLPDGNRGMAVLPPRTVAFADTINGVNDRWYFFEEMVSQVFPGGSYRRQDGDVYLFLFSQGCGGQALISFAQSGDCVEGLDFGPFIPVHEVGHALGRGHAGNGHNEANGGGFDAAYPGDHGQVEANTWGYDVWRDRVYPPDPSLTTFTEWLAGAVENEEGTTHDLMSYGPLPEWVSQYTWAGITEFLGQPAVSPALAPLVASATRASTSALFQIQEEGTNLRFAGFVSPSQEVFLRPVFEVMPEPALASKAAADVSVTNDTSNPLTGFSLRFRDANGNELLSVPLENHVPQDVVTFSALIFSELIAPPADWTGIELMNADGTAVSQWDRSPNVPLVELLLPALGENWGAEGAVQVSWDASDADSDELTYRVEGSPDKGETWYPLSREIRGETSTTVQLENVPGSGVWLIRVQASDGMNVGLSDSRDVTLAPKSPAPLILNPTDGSTFAAGQPVPLHGVASDWQDGVIDGGDFFWEVDGEFAAEGTATPTLNGLSEGEHVITLRVTNSAGLETTATSIVVIESPGNPPPPPSSLSLSSDPQQGVELMWEEVPGALTYGVQIATDNTFEQIVEEVLGVVAPMFFPENLESGPLYYWRVQAVSEFGAGPWSPASAVVNDAPPIIPQPDVAQANVLDPVTVRIIVGQEDRPVEDLFGVGFKLHYDPTRLEIAPDDIVAGPFLAGAELITFDPVIDDESGTISYSVTRKEGADGVSGAGAVAILSFRVKSDAPAGDAAFSLSDVLAASSEAQPIPLIPEVRSVAIASVVVWPGDTNNDGIVQIDDLLPIAFYFDERGPARPGADLLWRGQSAIPWEEVAATYADATGEGLVSQNDLLPMGLHFGKEHETTAGIAALGVHLATTRRLDVLRLPAMEAGTSVTVSLSVGEEAAPVESLLGVASEVVVPSVLRLIRTRPGEFLDDQDLLSFRNLDEDLGTLSVAYARKGRENPVSGAGEVLEIEFETIQTTEAPLEVVLQKTVLSFESGTQEVEPDGQPLVRLVSPQATDVERGETEIVTDYALEQNYPNPFNPSTLITFALPDAGHVSLVVFDLLGRSVATLVDAPLNAGRHTVRFDASGLPGGIYVYRLRANDYTSSKQLVLVK